MFDARIRPLIDPPLNRMGVALLPDGPGFDSRAGLSVLSEVITPGDIQMTGDGTPFVLIADCQTTGGYPRIGSVLPCDLPRVAQSRPGAHLRFRFVDAAEAREAEHRAADARAALDWLVEERDVAHHELIVFGHSLGGAIAIDTTAQRPGVAGLVVQSSFTQVVDMARHRYPDLPVHWIAKNGFRSIEKVAELDMPKLFVHGRQDETIPFAHGEALYEAASGPKDFLAVERAGHNDLHLWGGLRYFSCLARFRRRAEAYGAARAAALAVSSA